MSTWGPRTLLTTALGAVVSIALGTRGDRTVEAWRVGYQRYEVHVDIGGKRLRTISVGTRDAALRWFEREMTP